MTDPNVMDESLFEILEGLSNSSDDQPLDRKQVELAQQHFLLLSPNGFDQTMLHHIITKILKLNRLPFSRFTKFLYSAVPFNEISQCTVKEIFKHCLVFSGSSNKSLIERCKACLQYLIGLVKYKIAPVSYFESFYTFLYSFLTQKPLQLFAAHLIYYTTTYDNLTPYHISRIDYLAVKNGNQPHFLALASLFKKMKCHLMSPDVPNIQNEEACFTDLNSLIQQNMMKVQERRNIKVTNSGRDAEDLKMNQIVVKSRYYQDYERCYPQFDSLSSLLRFYASGSFDNFGTTYDALLLHEYNIVFISILSEPELVKFVYFLKKSWMKVIEDKHMDLEYKRQFVQSVYTVYEFLDDDTHIYSGNPRKYLRELISSDFYWILYATEVLDLFTVCRFENFKILFNELLVTIYKLFKISLLKLEYPLAFHIIKILTTFVRRAFEKIVNDRTEHMLPQNHIEKLSLAIEHLCKILINVLPYSFQAQITVLTFYYEMVQIVGWAKGLKHIQVIPTHMRHLLLINGSAVTLELYAKIILASVDASKNYPEAHHVKPQLSQQAQELYDFMFRDLDELEMFEKPMIKAHESFKQLVQLSETMKMYKLRLNIAFWHLTRLDENGKMRDTPKFDVNEFGHSYPHLRKLLVKLKLETKKSKPVASDVDDLRRRAVMKSHVSTTEDETDKKKDEKEFKKTDVNKP